ncbi:hypothetical protein VTK56DRAFT_6106 [Thermocarpiscus australiensis]
MWRFHWLRCADLGDAVFGRNSVGSALLAFEQLRPPIHSSDRVGVARTHCWPFCFQVAAATPRICSTAGAPFRPNPSAAPSPTVTLLEVMGRSGRSGGKLALPSGMVWHGVEWPEWLGMAYVLHGMDCWLRGMASAPWLSQASHNCIFPGFCTPGSEKSRQKNTHNNICNIQTTQQWESLASSTYWHILPSFGYPGTSNIHTWT